MKVFCNFSSSLSGGPILGGKGIEIFFNGASLFLPNAEPTPAEIVGALFGRLGRSAVP